MRKILKKAKNLKPGKIGLVIAGMSTAFYFAKKQYDQTAGDYNEWFGLARKNMEASLSVQELERYHKLSDKHGVNPELRISPVWKKLSKIKAIKNTEFDELAMEGGGGKGAIYPAVLDVLKPYLSGIKKVSGTSVGSLPTSLLAFGSTPEEIVQVSKVMTKQGLFEMNPIQHLKRAFTDRTEEQLIERLAFCEGDILQFALEEMLRDKIASGSLSSGRTLETGIKNAYTTILTKRQAENPKIKAYFEDMNITDASQITLRDIRHLSKVDSKFREFGAYITDRETGRSVFATADSMPDASLLKVVMASSALPGVFPPVRIDNKLYIDGGINNNSAIKTQDTSLSRVLHIPFYRGNDFPKGVEKMSFGTVVVGGFGQALFRSNYALNQVLSRMYLARMQSECGNVLYVHPGSLGTLTMSPSPETLLHAEKLAQYDAREFLFSRFDKMRQQEVESFEVEKEREAFAALENPEIADKCYRIAFTDAFNELGNMISMDGIDVTPQQIQRAMETYLEKAREDYVKSQRAQARQIKIEEISEVDGLEIPTDPHIASKRADM